MLTKAVAHEKIFEKMPEITDRHFKHLIYCQQNVLLLLTSHYSHFEMVKISLFRFHSNICPKTCVRA